jgi:DNA-binding NtrC family response regulator
MSSNGSNGSLIFVVDDEVIIAETLAIILRREGFDVESFTNPILALRTAKVTTPSLLISDVLMPEISGIDLAIQVRKWHPDCEILLFSGQANTVDLLKEARRNGYDFELIEKPIHPDDFIVRVNRACKKTEGVCPGSDPTKKPQ